MTMMEVGIKVLSPIETFFLPLENLIKIPSDLWEQMAEEALIEDYMAKQDNPDNPIFKRTFPIELERNQIKILEEFSGEQPQREYEPCPPDIRCLSTHAPFAYSIAMAKNDIEIRRKPTEYRGWTLINASLSKASDEAFAEYHINNNVPRGCIIGAAELVDCVNIDPGIWKYVFDNPNYFKKPIPIKGKQCPLWSAKSDIERKAFDLAWNQIDR
ncbi:hypothetical protein [Anabaena sp. CCY 9910]|uniref:hypothetical protein n=1 Tax=Anabaena sp. CCY 9910 TaxID=3103870 RepID=UPI0039DF5EC1